MAWSKAQRAGLAIGQRETLAAIDVVLPLWRQPMVRQTGRDQEPVARGNGRVWRQSLVFLNMPILQQPEAYVGNVGTLFGDDGTLVADGTRQFFATFIDAFGSWISRTHARPASE